MNVSTTKLPGVLLIEPRVFGDARGYFLESYSSERYREAGVDVTFVQDNVSRSRRGILRGLHFQQEPHAQGKLVMALLGTVLDVAVDVRPDSPTFGQWTAAELDASRGTQLYVPPGFAHGFCVLSDEALFGYKCSALYHAPAELGVRWDDPDVGVDWPLRTPELSTKDRELPYLKDIARELLPRAQRGPTA